MIGHGGFGISIKARLQPRQSSESPVASQNQSSDDTSSASTVKCPADPYLIFRSFDSAQEPSKT
eukprot:793476-Ditylum_brightwellii.AAC.1